MASLEAPVLVRPAHLWVPDHVTSEAEDVAALFSGTGLELDPEQLLALSIMLAKRPGGRWAALEAAVVAARQNLKTFLFKAIALGGIYLFDEERIVWTAHEFSTAMEGFGDLWEIIDGTPHLSKRVKKPNYSNGKEGIEFRGRQRIRFKARTKTGGRGLTGDRVFLDEAFALTASHMGSLMPTLSGKSMIGNPQIIYGSSAGQRQSAVLRKLRDRGRKGGDASLAYIEWCAPEGGCADEECDHRYGAEGCALDDPEKWRLANPAMGRRISQEFIEAERRSLEPSEFARERLGWWDEAPDEEEDRLLEAWALRGDESAQLADPVVFALDAAPFLASAAIAACSGRVVEVIEHGYGASWVPETLVELRRSFGPTAVGVDPAGPAGSLIPAIEKAGFTIRSKKNPRGLLVVLEGRESALACDSFQAAVMDDEITHRDQPALNDALAGASRRPVGDLWKWSRKDSTVDISPLVAVTVARFLANRPGPPPRVPLDPDAHRRPPTPGVRAGGPPRW